MELNKKGFTLVELLAVVVILLAISVVAVTSISAAIERSKEKQNDAKIEIIISYAKLYYDEHKNSLNRNSGCIELDKLKLSDAEIIDADGDYIIGVVKYNKEKGFWFDKDKEYCG